MVIHEDHFVPVTHSVGIEMVGLSHGQIRVSSYSSPLSHSLEGDGSGELSGSHCFLSSSRSWPWFPCASTSYTDSNHDNSRFCLVSQASGGHESCRSRNSLHDGLSSPAYCCSPEPVSEIGCAVSPPRLHVRIGHRMLSRGSG